MAGLILLDRFEGVFGVLCISPRMHPLHRGAFTFASRRGMMPKRANTFNLEKAK